MKENATLTPTDTRHHALWAAWLVLCGLTYAPTVAQAWLSKTKGACSPQIRTVPVTRCNTETFCRNAPRVCTTKVRCKKNTLCSPGKNCALVQQCRDECDRRCAIRQRCRRRRRCRMRNVCHKRRICERERSCTKTPYTATVKRCVTKNGRRFCRIIRVRKYRKECETKRVCRNKRICKKKRICRVRRICRARRRCRRGRNCRRVCRQVRRCEVEPHCIDTRECKPYRVCKRKCRKKKMCVTINAGFQHYPCRPIQGYPHIPGALWAHIDLSTQRSVPKPTSDQSANASFKMTRQRVGHIIHTLSLGADAAPKAIAATLRTYSFFAWQLQALQKKPRPKEQPPTKTASAQKAPTDSPSDQSSTKDE